MYGTLVIGINDAIIEINTKYMLYQDVYHNTVDPDLFAVLPEETLEENLQFFGHSYQNFDNVHRDISNIVNDISHLVPQADTPSPTAVRDSYETVGENLYKLRREINDHEGHHLANDFRNLDALLKPLNDMIQDYLSRRTEISNYSQGSVMAAPNFAQMMQALSVSMVEREKMSTHIQAAIERNQARHAAHIAYARISGGWSQKLNGGFLVVAGVASIVAAVKTAGVSIALKGIMGAGATGSIIYGGSNIWEGRQNITLGRVGNAETVAWNPIRDTVFVSIFGEDNAQRAWDAFGYVSIGTMVITGGVMPVYGAVKSGDMTFGRGVGRVFGNIGGSAATGEVSFAGALWATRQLGFSNATSAAIAAVTSSLTPGPGGGSQTGRAADVNVLNASNTNTPNIRADAVNTTGSASGTPLVANMSDVGTPVAARAVANASNISNTTNVSSGSTNNVTSNVVRTNTDKGVLVEFTNSSGNRTWYIEQRSNSIPNAIDSAINNSRSSRALEGRVADFVNQNTDGVTGFNVEVLRHNPANPNGQPIRNGEIDVATSRHIIEVKESTSAFDPEQIRRLTVADNGRFFNHDNKQVIVFIEQPIDWSNPFIANDLQEARHNGAIIVNSLEALGRVLRSG